MIEAQPAELFEATLTGAPTGLVGTISFAIIDPSDSSVEVAPRTDGIQEPAPGVYWTQEIAPLAMDHYLILWQSGSTTASEELFVGIEAPSTLEVPTTGYATVTDVRDYAPELSSSTDTEILTELRKAERDVDWYAGFGGAPNDVSGLRFDPLTDLDVPIAQAITRSTCAQVQYRFYMGPAFFVDEMQYPEVSGRDQSVKKPQRMGPQARSEFPQGVRKLTGRFA